MPFSPHDAVTIEVFARPTRVANELPIRVRQARLYLKTPHFSFVIIATHCEQELLIPGYRERLAGLWIGVYRMRKVYKSSQATSVFTLEKRSDQF
jgi:hypothetical protein